MTGLPPAPSPSALLLWASVLAAFLLVNEFASRSIPLPPEVFRKAAHIGIAVLVVAATVAESFDHRWWLPLGLLFALALLVARRLPLRSFSSRTDGSVGEVVYGVGVGLAALAPDVDVFCCAVLALGLADPMAQLVGTRLPIVRLTRTKSLGGVLACALTGAAVAVPLLPAAAWLPVAVVAAVAELFSPRGTDNLTIPALVALTATGVGALVGG